MSIINKIIRKLRKKRLINYTIVLLIILLLLDMSRMPKKQVSAKILLFMIRQYQRLISPRIGGFVHCKFEPTCSHYSYISIERYGAFWGSVRAMERLSRCSPWSDSQGYDPP